MTIKGSLQASIPIVKAFLMRNFLSAIENWRKMSVLGGKWRRNVKLFSGPLKAHPCVKPRHLRY